MLCSKTSRPGLRNYVLKKGLEVIGHQVRNSNRISKVLLNIHKILMFEMVLRVKRKHKEIAFYFFKSAPAEKLWGHPVILPMWHLSSHRSWPAQNVRTAFPEWSRHSSCTLLQEPNSFSNKHRALLLPLSWPLQAFSYKSLLSKDFSLCLPS